MTFAARIVEQQFTPAEAAIVSGVPVAQQRDWRRRDLIPGKDTKKWSRFGVTEIIDLAVMHFFTRAGIPPSSLSVIRRMAIMPTMRGIHDFPGGVVLTGKEVGKHDRWNYLFNMRPALTSHILVVTTQDDGTPNVGRVKSYADIESEIDDVGVPNCIILDCYKLAKRLVERTAAPLIQIEVSDRKTEPGDEPQHVSEQ